MGRAYSLDLRKRVVAAVIRGKSRRAAAALFDISVASVVKWTQRAYETGNRPAPRSAGASKVHHARRDFT
jgi:transposase